MHILSILKAMAVYINAYGANATTIFFSSSVKDLIQADLVQST